MPGAGGPGGCRVLPDPGAEGALRLSHGGQGTTWGQNFPMTQSLVISVADPERFNPDPDPATNF